MEYKRVILDGEVYFKFGEYLSKKRSLARDQASKAQIPSIQELAEAAGVGPPSLSKLIHGRTLSLSFKIASAILTEMRRRGFDTRIDDILGFEEPVFFEKEDE